jgi:hypothetical protein
MTTITYVEHEKQSYPQSISAMYKERSIVALILQNDTWNLLLIALFTLVSKGRHRGISLLHGFIG